MKRTRNEELNIMMCFFVLRPTKKHLLQRLKEENDLSYVHFSYCLSYAI